MVVMNPTLLMSQPPTPIFKRKPIRMILRPKLTGTQQVCLSFSLLVVGDLVFLPHLVDKKHGKISGITSLYELMQTKGSHSVYQ